MLILNSRLTFVGGQQHKAIASINGFGQDLSERKDGRGRVKSYREGASYPRQHSLNSARAGANHSLLDV